DEKCCWKPGFVAFLLSLCLGALSSVATCPLYCLCANLSHNALTVLPLDWISQPFDRLSTLVLSRNSISQIETNAFAVTPNLLQLDLSSNQLTVLNSSIFTGLTELRELLLFGNKIIQINPEAFSDLRSLKRLYLSGNRLEDFPYGLYQESGGPLNLTFLDLSNNRLSKAPVQSLLSFSRQSGIYLQENPFVCDCTLLALIEYWMWKQYRPLLDFRVKYPCMDNIGQGSKCSKQVSSKMPLEENTFQVEPGKCIFIMFGSFLGIWWVKKKKKKVGLHQKDLSMPDNLLVSQQIIFSEILLHAYSYPAGIKVKPFSCALFGWYFSQKDTRFDCVLI
uniref:LRRCT domain-containing protein n=1 Tax=Labrus bergylta TaxID=56723 RepID=A0A3Q3GIL5_9LABR